MKGLKGLGLGLLAVVALVFAIGAGILATSQVSAVSHSVDVHDGTAAPGEEVSVDVGAHDITAPGLGAWGMNVSYDVTVVTAVACSPLPGGGGLGNCNVDFAPDTVRLNGAATGGLEGDIVLATITFRCETEGSTTLTLTVDTLADATTGDPQAIDAATSNGSITCAEPPDTPTPGPATDTPEPLAATATATEGPELPPTGTGSDGSGSGLGWLVAALAGVGVAAAAGFGALRLRARKA